MSARIRTLTPFVDKELLIKALENLGVKYTINKENIITERKDYYGQQIFVWNGNKYSFLHDSSAETVEYVQRWGRYPESWKANWKQWQSVSDFLNAVEKEYQKLEEERKRRLEELRRKQLAAQEYEKFRQQAIQEAEELRRLEQAQKQAEEKKQKYIEETVKKIEQKAKEQGYTIKKKKVGNKIKIVLRRNV